jgi:hypothetical protein
MNYEAPFRLKPWYIGIFTAGRWVTIYPYINLPRDRDPNDYPWVVAHESVHIKQQGDMGLWKWLWKYFTNRAFRLDQEAEGVVAEYQAQVSENRNASMVFPNYASALSSIDYFWAARSTEEAMEALNSKLIITDLKL